MGRERVLIKWVSLPLPSVPTRAPSAHMHFPSTFVPCVEQHVALLRSQTDAGIMLLNFPPPKLRAKINLLAL